VAGDPLELTRAGAWNDRPVDLRSVTGKYAAVVEYERALSTLETPADAVEREINRRTVLGRCGKQLSRCLAFEIALETALDVDSSESRSLPVVIHLRIVAVIHERGYRSPHLLTPQPRLSPYPEAALESPILLAILTRCPNEEVADDSKRDDKDDHSDYLDGELHRESVLPG
jgi:hypothetical protein